MFQNREEAGDRLAALLNTYQDHPSAIILALPRGGVSVGYRMSLALRLPLDVFITRKLGAPGNPELAIGALAETGTTFLNQEVINSLAVSSMDLEREVRIQQEEIARRQVAYRSGRPLPSLGGRTVILVDDGIATGATFFASVSAVRSLRPERIVGAIPVGPIETIERLRQQLEEVVVLDTPAFFFAVGNQYADFRQVEDNEVTKYLSLAASALESRSRAAEA